MDINEGMTGMKNGNNPGDCLAVQTEMGEKRDALYNGNRDNDMMRMSGMRAASPSGLSSGDRGCPSLLPCPGIRGSMTVEAAFAVPVFFLALLAVCWILPLLSVRLQNTSLLMNATVNYETYGTKLSSIAGFLKSGTVILWDEQETPFCYIKVSQKLPFGGMRLRTYQQMQCSRYEGVSMASQSSGTGWVYLAERASVYHEDVMCSYLKPTILSYTPTQAQEQRNRSGEKYYACEGCCKGGESPAGVVYLSPYGNRFHATRDCPKLKRNVRRVRREEVGNLPPCSKCGRERSEE